MKAAYRKLIELLTELDMMPYQDMNWRRYEQVIRLTVNLERLVGDNLEFQHIRWDVHNHK